MNNKIEIVKIGKEYYEHKYKINLDVPQTLYLPQQTLFEDIEGDTYHFECWEYVVDGSWNRSSKNKLRYYAPVYRNARNKPIRLDVFIYEDDTVEKAQEKIKNSMNDIKNHLIELENEYLRRIKEIKNAIETVDKCCLDKNNK